MGTISGTLSHYSRTYFRSGSEDLQEPGWWTLAQSVEPELVLQQREFVHVPRGPLSLLLRSVAESPVLELFLPGTSRLLRF